MSAVDKLIAAAAMLLIAISLLNPGGLIVGLTLAVVLLGVWYGGRYLLDMEKSRRMGERAGLKEQSFRERIAGGDDDNSRWNR